MIIWNQKRVIFIDGSALDFSLIPIYDFNYGYMVPKRGKKRQNIYMDTESSIL